MKRLMPLLGAAAIILIIAYYETAYSIEDGAFNEQYDYPQIPVVNESSEEDDVTVSASEDSDPLAGLTPEIELKYESETIEDGYLVETHRQYEVYRDHNNQIIQSVPTSHYEYIRYRIE
ncbi:MAG: hypothetical protein AB2374_14810 [Cytobacillus gottheilii]|uniref:hypothetical protein n=1 Tax=Cytobacillus gottheilii TaxID=859144 RepID=UPI0008363825|nr:hypothetical protein [Cytobacillus gottheilii]